MFWLVPALAVLVARYGMGWKYRRFKGLVAPQSGSTPPAARVRPRPAGTCGRAVAPMRFRAADLRQPEAVRPARVSPLMMAADRDALAREDAVHRNLGRDRQPRVPRPEPAVDGVPEVGWNTNGCASSEAEGIGYLAGRRVPHRLGSPYPGTSRYARRSAWTRGGAWQGRATTDPSAPTARSAAESRRW